MLLNITIDNLLTSISILITYTGDGFRGGEHRGTCSPPPPYFFAEAIAHKQKIQKRNINKIYQTEPSLKEMNCLMTIAERKNTFSALQFFHKHYLNNGSGKLIAAVRVSNLKRSELWKSITSLYTLRKSIVTGQKQPLRGVSRKQLILNCKNVKTDNLQLENP